MGAKPSAAEHGVATAPPGPIPAGFEDNLGWLLAQCFRAHVLAMDHAMADFPHGHRGFQALSGAANCSAHNQAGLAKQLGVDRTVMVYLVDDLEKAGLVERVPDPSDRRSRLIRATPTGLARLATAQSAISAAEAELLGVLDDEQQKSLRAMLRDLAAHHFGAMDTATACSIADRVRETSV
jgi:MarR family transcriptional regulator for hemolysin